MHDSRKANGKPMMVQRGLIVAKSKILNLHRSSFVLHRTTVHKLGLVMHIFQNGKACIVH